MSYESLPIRLHAENVETNIQKVYINHCPCGSRFEELIQENAQLKNKVLENRKLLQRIELLLHKVASSFPASVDLASVSASAEIKNHLILSKHKLLN